MREIVSKRVFGIETEFGCMTEASRSSASPEGVAARIRDYVFHELQLGISDMHYREWGEPPGNGGFLFNGGRLYIDMGHLEYVFVSEITAWGLRRGLIVVIRLVRLRIIDIFIKNY